MTHTLIYTRTQDDVEQAKEIRREKIQKFQELTSDEVQVLERGMMTVNTLNRIEATQDELKGLLNHIGYWNTPIITKTWDETQMFDEGDFRRIINNLNILRMAFFTYKNTPPTPSISFRYDDLNAIEKILHDLDVMINDVKSHYKRCGTVRCGEV